MTSIDWFETHTHLSDPQFNKDREAAIERACERNLRTLIEIGAGPEEWEGARRLANQRPDLFFFSAGIHPHYADQNTEDIFSRFETAARDPLCVAIGEIGFDTVRSTTSLDEQRLVFDKSIDLALKLDKPVILHCREAYPELFPRLEKIFPKAGPHPSGVAHCFSGSYQDAVRLLDMGFTIGVDGPVTYPKANELRETLKRIPIDRLVIETDSPYLPPQPFRGKRNEPAYLPLIGEALAALHQIPVPEVACQLLKNSQALFRLKPR